MGVEPYLTATAVDCVIAQRLARRLCERCKEPTRIGRDALEAAGFPFDLVPEPEWAFHKTVGCEECGGTGYRGRVGAYELMVITDEVRDMILRRTSTREVAKVARTAGMLPLRDDGLSKAARGITTVEEVLRTVV